MDPTVTIAFSQECAGLGEKIAIGLQARSITLESRIFPDGESYLRFGADLSGQDLIIVKSCFPQQDKRLIELLFALDAAKELGARRTIAVVPYLAYARQDRRFRPGEVVSNSTVGRLLEAVRTDLLVTVDVHQRESLKNYRIGTVDVSAMPLLAEYLNSMGLDRPYILAPDKGASAHAQCVASILGTEYTHFEKRRDRVTGQIVMREVDADIEGRDAVILDDIISTGATIAEAARIVKKLGARKIIAACTHALLIGDAMESMVKGGITEVISTDTVAGSTSKVSVAPAISDSLRQHL
ncbi:ribose-phosphate diphosphokinase [Candidatus Bathyarchaeota archaeon]|nr:ribose-phosphate diphosphokinase [Candidatus Bathyarchaeota archaeon]